MKLHRTFFDIGFAAVVIPSIRKMAKRCYKAGLLEGRQQVTQEFIKGGFIPTAQLVSNPEHLRDIEAVIQYAIRNSEDNSFSRIGAQRYNEIVCRVRAQRLTLEQTAQREKTAQTA